MNGSVTRGAIADRLGKRRGSALDAWLLWGLIPPAGDEGRWSEEIWERIDHAQFLRAEARRLSRRALLLHRDGFKVPWESQQLAMADVVPRIARPRHKMAQVQAELRVFFGQASGRRSRGILPESKIEPSMWRAVIEAASGATFEKWASWAFRFLPAVTATRESIDPKLNEDVPVDEHVSLIVVEQLLNEPEVVRRLERAKVQLFRSPRRARTRSEWHNSN